MSLVEHRKTAAIVLLLALILGVATYTVIQIIGESSRGPVAWMQPYHCVNGHRWEAGLASQPVCPECGEPAIRDNKYICPKCRKVFLGYESKKLGVGEFEYRLAGSDEWTRTGPDSLICPNCEHKDNPFEFSKPPLGSDPALGSVIDRTGTASRSVDDPKPPHKPYLE